MFKSKHYLQIYKNDYLSSWVLKNYFSPFDLDYITKLKQKWWMMENLTQNESVNGNT